MTSGALAQADWYVKTSGSDTNDGQTWTTAFATIQKAVTSAVQFGGYEIWVGKGTYVLSSPLTIPSTGSKIPLKIYAGFFGDESSLVQRNWVANPTTIDGNNVVESVIVVNDWVDLIDGFTITGGTNGSFGAGGGIDIRGCGNAAPQPVLRNLVIRGNGGDTSHPPAYYDGGGVYIEDCSPWIINTTFSNNRVWAHGGALFARDSDGSPIDTYPKIVNSTFTGNHADVNGGAVGVYRGTLTVVNSILWGDSAGDGVTNEAYGGTLSIEYSDIDQADFAGTNGNIQEDPKLAGAGRFHLLAGSPCIDAGDDLKWTTFTDGFELDFDGDDRFLDGGSGNPTIDMGADEYVPGAALLLHVDGTSGSDSKSGLDWANALATIQAAVTEGLGFDTEIWVKQGTYALSGPIVLSPANTNVGIYGGFVGNEIVRSARSTDPSLTVIDGQLLHRSIDLDWTASPGTAGLVVDGLTLTRGPVRLNFADDVKFTNCRITNSTGGGIFFLDSDLVIDRCLFSGNTSVLWPGAVSGGFLSELTITDSTFLGNSATGSSALGGAISVSQGTIERSSFFGNHSDRWGGAIFHNGNDLVIRNSVFSGNTASNSTAAISKDGGTVDIVNSTFFGNSAPGGGAVGLVSSMTNSVLWGNSPRGTSLACTSGLVTYSLVDGPGYDDITNCQTPYGNLSTDPLFVDSDGIDETVGTTDDDLSLQAGSEAIDAGDSTALGYGSVDIVLNPRHSDDSGVVDSGYGPPPIIDMGAYERQGSVPADDYDLTMAVVGSGTTLPPVGSHEHLRGSVVNISATADPGWLFTGWTGWVDDPMSAATTVTVTWDLTVTANFKKIQVLTVDLQGTGAATVTSSPTGISCPPDCDETFDYGTAVTLSATMDPGTFFDGWMSEACAETGDCSIDMDANYQVAALCNLEGTCGIGDDMTLAGMTVDWAHTFEACTSISAGSGFQVVSPGDVVFRAGGEVILADGFSVGDGSVWKAEVSGQVALRSIAVSKTANPTSVDAGATVTYTISVENDGQGDLWQVSVLDDKCSANPVVQSGDDGDGVLEPGETWVFECSGPAEASDFVNTATATFADTFGQEVSGSGLASVTVAPGACATDRYVDLGDGTVLDCNNPSIVWLQDTSCDALGEGDGNTGWDPATATLPTAVTKVALLEDGLCGLSDGSAPGDWSLPAMTQLCASWTSPETGQVCYESSYGIPNTGLINNDCVYPAVETSDGSCPSFDDYPDGDPFIGLDTWGGAWSSQQYSTNDQWIVVFSEGNATSTSKTSWRGYSVPIRSR